MFLPGKAARGMIAGRSPGKLGASVCAAFLTITAYCYTGRFFVDREATLKYNDY
ncbi:MAG: hypothetical protein ACYCX2_12080 [Christensenellales bacterium]